MASMEIIHIGGDGVARSSGEFSLDKSEAGGIGPRHNGKANPMFKLEIATDNAAFEHGGAAEIARILRDTADRIAVGCFTNDDCKLRDLNGNTVGAVDWVSS